MSSTSPRSVAEVFLNRVRAMPDRDAFEFPGPGGDGWRRMTWQQSGDYVEAVALGLRAIGVESEQRCALLANTRVEWIFCDLGILCAGAATTTIYASNTPEECAFIVNDSQSVVVFAEDDAQVAKLVEKRAEMPTLMKVVTLDGQAGHDGWVITVDELKALGDGRKAANANEFEEVIATIEKDHLATLIYTSGTTGLPKGVELTHDCWVFEGEAIEELGIISAEDHQYLWLPLAHSFGKVLEAAQLQIGFLTTVDGRIPKLVENLAVVRPTFMAAAPRIFEKVYNKIVTGAEAAGGAKLKILRWAIKVGKQVSKIRQDGQEPGGLLGLQFALADRLVFSKLRARFGGRLKFFISGSAPLSRDMAEFFHAAGILIYEGYGLTESSAASFVNRPGGWKFGTVGLPVPGVEIKILPETKEILISGRGIMRGYHGLPEATAECLQDGWLHTGDAGELDDHGFLRITDRIKELIKTSGGKYVAPQKLEARLKALCPYIGQVVVHGNNRNFCSALVTLDPESFPAWVADQGIAGEGMAEWVTADAVVGMVQTAVDQLNEELARYETIKKFSILEKDFTIEDGLVTPSMKVKRKAVEKTYADVLDGFYVDTLKQV